MTGVAIRVLRIVLVLLLLGSVLGQLLVPVVASASTDSSPEVEYLVVPYSVAGILVIACGQIALLVVWRLLSLVSNGVIFTRSALRWVDVIAACGLVATIVTVGVLVHLVVVGVSHLMVTLGLVASALCGTAFVLLMIVMRGLLESAIADRSELDEVI